MLNFEISVRGLVEFICRSGSIDKSEGSALDPNAMQEGIKAHKSFQASQGPEYNAEVSLSRSFFINNGKDCMNLKLGGRADGIFEGKKYIHENVTINGITSVKTTHKDIYTIDEIKSTYKNTRKMKEAVPVHLAQAKCYAYMYSLENRLPEVSVRMVYIGINNKKTTYFNYDYTFAELAGWFRNVINNFAIFALWQYRHILDRNAILKDAPFPFEYRPGQDRLTKDVYRSILREKRLFIEAPTGAGKTVSTLYPAVIGLCYGLENRIFYLTAKTITRTVACQTLKDIESALPAEAQRDPDNNSHDRAGIRSEVRPEPDHKHNGLLRSVVITARDKICLLENGKCSPRDCPYAKGHFDRINAALLYLLKNETLMDQNVFERYGEERKVCPYYLAIDAAMFSDVVICDYNYAFDPEVSFKDLFTPGSTPDISGKFAKKPVFLIDEAHNLVRRAREMYSARISTEDIRRFKAVINKLKKENAKYKEKNEGKAEEDAEPSHKQLSIFDSSDTKYITDKVPGISNDRDEDQGTREDDDGDGPESGAYALRNILMRVTRSVNVLDKRLKEADEKASYGYYNTEKLDPEQTDTIAKTLEPLIKSISRLLGNSGFQKILHASKASDEFLDFYFNVLKVNNTFAECDDSYLFYLTDENINGSNPSDSGGFLSFRKNGTQKKNICLHLKNMSPRTMLSPYLDRARASILFSATLLPVNYFFNELGGREDDYKIYAPSSFDNKRRLCLTASDVSTLYKQRTPQMYRSIAEYILEFVSSKTGNYMIFFSSYKMMGDIGDILEELSHDNADMADNQGYNIPAEGQLPDKDHNISPFEKNISFIRQEQDMKESQRDDFLNEFRDNTGTDRTLVGLCVLGGIFGEGIDLTGESLIGVAIVGPGLPQVSTETRLYQDYSDSHGRDGFKQSYVYPGMNKVTQAGGRLIRTSEDYGVILLLDSRFERSEYKDLLPREWLPLVHVNRKTLGEELRNFWRKY